MKVIIKEKRLIHHSQKLTNCYFLVLFSTGIHKVLKGKYFRSKLNIL